MLRRGRQTAVKISKGSQKFPLTHNTGLLFYASRETAGPTPSAESVFFSGPTSQFSAVDDCLRLGFAVYAKDDL